MKYAIAVIAAAALMAGLITCNHDCYADLHQALDQQVDLIRDCGERVARARNPADVVCIINRFSASMEKLSPRVQRLGENIRNYGTTWQITTSRAPSGKP